MQEVALAVSVVSEHVVDSVAVFTDSNSLKAETVLHDTLVLVLAENHLFAVNEVDSAIVASSAVGDVVVDAVVENHTVLEDFNDRATFVLSSSYHHFLSHLRINVDSATEECATSAEHEFCRHKWVFSGAVRR